MTTNIAQPDINPATDSNPVGIDTTNNDFQDYVEPAKRKFSLSEAANFLRRHISIRITLLVALGALGVYGYSKYREVEDATNASASIILPNRTINRTGDTGPRIIEGTFSDAKIPGQADPETRRFLSNLNLGPDDIETRIKDVVERNKSNGIDMTTLDPLYNLAELNSNDPKSLGAVGDVKVITSLYRIIGYRMNGAERINGLQLQASLNLPTDSTLFYNQQEGTLIVQRLDGKPSPYANWLIRAVNRK